VRGIGQVRPLKGTLAGLKSVSPRLLIRILCCVAVGVVLVLVSNSDGAMSCIQTIYAHVTAWVLNLFGEGAAVLTNTVQSSRFGVNVVTACTGIFLTGIFVVAVIAWPARLRATLSGAGLGILGIALLNVVRLVSLYYIGVHLPEWLDIAHVVVWQSLMILAAVALWIAWAGAQRARPERSEQPGGTS